MHFRLCGDGIRGRRRRWLKLTHGYGIILPTLWSSTMNQNNVRFQTSRSLKRNSSRFYTNFFGLVL